MVEDFAVEEPAKTVRLKNLWWNSILFGETSSQPPLAGPRDQGMVVRDRIRAAGACRPKPPKTVRSGAISRWRLRSTSGR